MHFYMSQASEVYSIFGEVYFRINKHAIQKFQTIIPEMTFLPKNSLSDQPEYHVYNTCIGVGEWLFYFIP